MEPIAIVGLALKFPGDATDPTAFFRMLQKKGSARAEIPKDRFNLDAFYHPDKDRPGAINIRHGHFLKDDIAAFDAKFFSMTPSGAASMDPQQRGLLETSYHAMENAGMPLDKVTGSDMGVFVGCFTREYEATQYKDPEVSLRYVTTGTGVTMLANRLSYFYDLHGPSITLDTACSSSLNATHLACSSLRQRECRSAIAAGCNLFFSPDQIIPLASFGFLSKDGRCHSFDHRANGYSRGEGFGVIVLKRLDDAIADGDVIRAVIRGSASNQDGKSPGITQPMLSAQMGLIRSAYRNAGIGLEHTRFFEAHGTGTAVGDPIEASGIGGVFSEHRSKDSPLYVGAVKSNIGHLEASAGMAGLLKSVLILENGIIPPNINMEKVNPKIPADEWGICFPTESVPWPEKGLRRASVNAFGYGGSNAHVILDDALHYLELHGLKGKTSTVRDPPGLESRKVNGGPTPNGDNSHAINGHIDGSGPNGTTNGHTTEELSLGIATNGQEKTEPLSDTAFRERLFIFSAIDEASADRLAAQYADQLEDSEVLKKIANDESSFLDDLCFTLAEHRTSFAWKFTVVASTVSALASGLRQKPKATRITPDNKLGLVFTGQGAQWHAMGRELMSNPIYRGLVLDADVYLQDLGSGWSVVDELSRDKENSSINKPEISQPLCTVLQVALVDLLVSWGIQYKAVCGHSSGEIVAAYAVGAISRESAWKLAYYRGIVSAELAQNSDGAMLAVSLRASQAEKYLSKILISPEEENTAAIACYNSPVNVTLSGKRSSIEKIKAALDNDNVFNRKLQVGVAYHSPYTKAVAEKYRKQIGFIRPGEVRDDMGFFSSLYGCQMGPTKLQDPDYWVQNLTSPVRFDDAMKVMCSTATTKTLDSETKAALPGHLITGVLEIGPHGALRGPLREIKEKSTGITEFTYSTMLRRGSSAWETSLVALGELIAQGHRADITKASQLDRNSVQMLVTLPGYPFDHSRSYWSESRISKEYRFRKTLRNELLGTPTSASQPDNAIWRNYIRMSESPWMKDHKVTGSMIYPAAGMLVAAIEAALQIADSSKKLKSFRLRNVKFSTALPVDDTASGKETRLSLTKCHEIPNTAASHWGEFVLTSYNEGEWREHCRGFIVTEYEAVNNPVDGGLSESIFVKSCAADLASIEARCTSSVPPSQMYDQFSAVGFEFGPTFQTVHEVKHGSNLEATAVITAPSTTALSTNVHVSPHLIHPTMLDGVLQGIIIALTKGGKDINQVMVPSEIKELWIDAASNSTLTSVRFAAQAEMLGIRQASAQIKCFDVTEQKPVIFIDGYIVTRVTKNEDASEQVPRGLCLNVEWKPDPAFLDQDSVQSIATISATSDEIVQLRDRIAEVEMLCFLYIRRYLKDHPNPETIVPAGSYLAKYAQWMKHQADKFEKGLIPQSTPSWHDLANDASAISQLEQRLDSSSTDGALCVAVGRLLPAILKGEVDPLGVLFSDDKLAENVYRYGAGMEIGYEKMSSFLDALAHQNPALRVLEIGAGTGGATRSILKCLTAGAQGEAGAPRFSEYAFTDISIGFFEKAKELFASTADRMVFKALDVEKDVEVQGFEKHSYDVVVAANAAHATRSLTNTLSNIRKLLKPGGKVILFELTNTDMIRIPFAFGLLPGWWLSEEESRPWGALAGSETWSTALRQSGFYGLDIDLVDVPDPKSHSVSVLISTALGEERKERASAGAITVIIDESSPMQRELASLLAEQLGPSSDTTTPIIDIHSMTAAGVQGQPCVFLADLETPFLENPTKEAFSSLQLLTSSAAGILWLTQGGGPSPTSPEAELVAGLARCLRAENPSLNFVTLSVHDTHTPPKTAATIQKVLRQCFAVQDTAHSATSDNTFFERDGIIYTPRVVESKAIEESIASKTVAQIPTTAPLGSVEALTLKIASPGLLDSFRFEDDPIHGTPLGDDDVEVQIHATGLNLHDVVVALGQVIGDAFGREGAGIVTRRGSNAPFKSGQRVCGLFQGAFNTYARTKYEQLAAIPDDVSFPEAAAIPVVYTTAYYGLYEIGRLRKGETVLIHWGSGGLGQAAIQLALLAGANIITTVGSIEKRDFIRETYGIPNENILASRDLSFAAGVMRLTSGRGVDVVLNSMSGQGLRSTWECIAPFGRFVEAGKVDIYNSHSLPMDPFKRNASFSFIDVGLLAKDNGSVFSGILTKVVDLFAQSAITPPQPLHRFGYDQIQEAFRTMQAGTHMGKFVLEPHAEDVVPILPSSKPAYDFLPGATYVITGGMGGLGRATATWMASRGARNIVLLSRSGLTHPAAPQLKSELEAMGVKLYAPACDVSNEEELSKVLAECKQTLPPIRGAILGAMALSDSTFTNMIHENYLTAVRPKVKGSWNMHRLLDRDLDFFILLSSISGIIGNRGQSNYCVGNTFQDALARYRVGQGLKATSVDLGMILSVGFTAENNDAVANLQQAGINAMRQNDYFALLDVLCDPTSPTPTPLSSQILTGIEIPEVLHSKGISEPSWMQDPLFSALYQIRSSTANLSKDEQVRVSWSKLLSTSTTTDQAADIATQAIVEKLSKGLSTSASEIDTAKPLHAYGVDSLVAVELRAWFPKELGAEVAVFDIMGENSIRELGVLAAKRSTFVAGDGGRVQ